MNQYKTKLLRNINEALVDIPMYIQLCMVFTGSGANRTEITRLFTEFMPKDGFSQGEKKELIDYLLKRSYE